ncbi:hypothetical protein [Streptomyces sp. NPDC052107]|uniref:hypothetical protein n=1 Tax=Streptomyces sp. NPDC052107 TaxID=3155632 RepID=UPI003428AD42
MLAVTARAVGVGGGPDAAGVWSVDPLMVDRSAVAVTDQAGAFGPGRGRPFAVLPGLRRPGVRSRARRSPPLGT